jgi:hypothetical protein
LHCLLQFFNKFIKTIGEEVRRKRLHDFLLDFKAAAGIIFCLPKIYKHRSLSKTKKHAFLSKPVPKLQGSFVKQTVLPALLLVGYLL